MIIDIKDKQFALLNCFESKDIIKNDFGGMWDKKSKSWLLPVSSSTLKRLKDMFNPILTQETVEYLNDLTNLNQEVEQLKKRKIKPKYEATQHIRNATLMEHQNIASNIVLELYNKGRNGVMLDMEMGTGKTMTSIAVVGAVKPKKVLIICPKISLGVWKREYEKFANYEYHLGVLIGTARQRINVMNYLIESHRPDIIDIAVINYEYVPAFEEILFDWKPDMIICDESHKIKSPSAQMTKTITKLGNMAKYKLCLTGTPMTNSICDFFSQYKFLDSSIFGNSFVAFKNKYIITGYFGEVIKPNPMYFNEFKQRLGYISYRVTKEECLDLPETTDIDVSVEFSDKEMKQYKELEKEYVLWLNENTQISAESALTQTLKLRQLTGGFFYDVDALGQRKTMLFSDAKLNACMELLENLISEGNKVIVFAEFQSEIEAIANACEKAKYKYVTYYGKTSEKNKDTAYKEFQEGDAQVFIGQIESAGISITLHSSNYVIFYSTGYKYGVYDQARSRIHRKGQEKKCFYYHLTIDGTIDKKIMASLNNKEQVASSIIDSYRGK